MSDRSVKVQLTADTSAYLEAMKTALEATDTLRDSLKELRKEQRGTVVDSWTGSNIAESVFELLDAGVSREDIRDGGLTATLLLAGGSSMDASDAAKLTGLAAQRFSVAASNLPAVADMTIASEPDVE